MQASHYLSDVVEKSGFSYTVDPDWKKGATWLGFKRDG